MDNRYREGPEAALDWTLQHVEKQPCASGHDGAVAHLGAVGPFDRNLIESLPGLIAVMDKELIFRLLSPTFRSTMAPASGDLIGKRFKDAFEPWHVELEAVARQVVESGQVQRMSGQPTMEEGPPTERLEWQVLPYRVFGGPIVGVILYGTSPCATGTLSAVPSA